MLFSPPEATEDLEIGIRSRPVLRKHGCAGHVRHSLRVHGGLDFIVAEASCVGHHSRQVRQIILSLGQKIAEVCNIILAFNVRPELQPRRHADRDGDQDDRHRPRNSAADSY